MVTPTSDADQVTVPQTIAEAITYATRIAMGAAELREAFATALVEHPRWRDAIRPAIAAQLDAYGHSTPDAAARIVIGRGAADDWPEPRPIPSGLAPVEPFKTILLPDALRPWIEDIAERAATPPDFAAAATMVGAASLIGRRVAPAPSQRFMDGHPPSVGRGGRS